MGYLAGLQHTVCVCTLLRIMQQPEVYLAHSLSEVELYVPIALDVSSRIIHNTDHQQRCHHL